MTQSAYNFPRDLFLGFDSLFDNLYQYNDNQQSKQSYPPYNVVKKDENHYLIEIAVAGFKSEDIDLTLEKGILTVAGDKKMKEGITDYIRKGISNRNFKRSFTLADTIKVVGADVVDGLLLIGLENVVPEEEKPKTINLGEFTKSAKKILLG
ncbi:Hsp20 family protein [candidate division WWE3 bacterium]|jgi:molecular chaperone IbpA|nr:Hsp20 family protein [candidate division WWE3 bacterium]